MNINGPQNHMMKKGGVRFRITVALVLLCRLCEKQSRAANYLGVNEKTIRRCIAGERTEITVKRIQEAAEKYAEYWRNEVEPYEWAGILALVKLIHPRSQLLYVRPKRGFPTLVEQHLREHMDFALSNTFWHFVGLGVDKEHVRKTIRRVIARHPELAERDIDDSVVTVRPDPIDKHMVKPRQPKVAKSPAVKAKPSGTAKKAVDKKPRTKKPPAPTTPRGVEPAPKAEPTVIDRIIEKGGASQAVQDRVNKLLGLST